MRPNPEPVLDASALLAYLQREPGYQHVQSALQTGAVISAVNLAEVSAGVVGVRLDLAAVALRLVALGLTAVPFTADDARASAALYPQTQSLGLSLADRACLALGLRRRAPVLTTDHSWVRSQPGVDVRLIR